MSVGSRPMNITFHVHELSSKPSQPGGIQIFRREAFDFEKRKWLCVFHDDLAFEYSRPPSLILVVRNGCIRWPAFKMKKSTFENLKVSQQQISSTLSLFLTFTRCYYAQV